MKKTVVLYVRESYHAGAEESLERQKEKLKAFCKQKSYSVIDVVSVIGSRQDSISVFKQAIERAKNTESNTLLMSSSNRIVGTASELKTVVDIIKDSGVSIATMDGSYERVQLYGTSPEALVAVTLYNGLDVESK